MRIVGILICACWLALAGEAAGADYFPLAEGVVYEYEYSISQPSGWYLTGTYATYFSGTADIGGTITRVLHRAGGVDDGVRIFWSETAEGDKLGHGGSIQGTLVTYSPPILMIDAPLYVGKTWEVDSQDSDGLATHFHFEVTAQGEVAVPAGTFEAFTIRETVEWPEGGRTGRLYSRFRWTSDQSDIAKQVAHYSYADGIGLILYRFGGRIDRLLSLRTISVQPATWTGIRLLYR